MEEESSVQGDRGRSVGKQALDLLRHGEFIKGRRLMLGFSLSFYTRRTVLSMGFV